MRDLRIRELTSAEISVTLEPSTEDTVWTYPTGDDGDEEKTGLELAKAEFYGV